MVLKTKFPYPCAGERLSLRLQICINLTCTGFRLIQTDCLLRIDSSTAILNYFERFESILGIVTTLRNKNVRTLRYLRPS